MLPRRDLVAPWGWMFLIGVPFMAIYALMKWVMG
jgi:hypothetical protein